MQTRLLLLLPLLLAGHAYADWSDSISSLYTARHKRAINYYEDITEPVHVRAKRAILAAIGYRSKCTFGWTGQFCENPVCLDRRQLPERETDLEKEVDLIHLQQDCAGEYYIPFDSLSGYLYITVTTDAGTPRIVLSDARGNELEAVLSDRRVGYAEGRYEGLPGDYLLTIDNSGVPTPNCIVHVKAGSPLTFDTGFVPGPQVDNPPFGESGEEGVPNYFVAHPFGLPGAGEVRTVSIRIDGSPLPAYRSTLTKRFGCAYEYYAGEFTCQLNRQYTQTIEGIDDRGYTFRRTRAIGCYPNRNSGGTTTQPAVIYDCVNNGTFYVPQDSEILGGVCLCDELFTGNQCQQVNCMNGGLPIPNDIAKCDCSPGYHGNSCEQVSCVPNEGQYLTDQKTLIVVIRDNINMAQNIPAISQAIDNEYTQHVFDGHDAYDSFVLITVSNGNFNARRTYGPREFASFMSALEALQSTTTVGDCQDDVLSAAGLVFVKEVNPQSPVFIFTDVPVTDRDLSTVQGLATRNAVLKFHFHTFFLPAAPACPIDTNDFHYNVYQQLAQYTGGLFHTPSVAGLGGLFTISMRTTVYHMNFVDMLDLDQCDTNRRALIVDTSAEVIIIAATGSNLQVSITDPSWNPVSLTPEYAADGSFFWEINNPRAGEYIYTLHSTDPTTQCSYRIYAQSEFDLFFGITAAVDVDVLLTEPVVDAPAHLVAQLNGFGGGYIQDPFRLFTEVLITAPGPQGGKPAPVYYSNGIARSDCGFHFYFGVANFCRYPDQRFYVTVYADDFLGFPVQRTSVGYCVPAPSGPTRAPEGACDHGGVPVAGNGTACICPAHYSGPRCEEIECQNGGTPTREGRCACGYGHTGTFCEISTCPVRNDQDDVTFDHKTLTLIISARTTMRGVVTSIYNKALEFARDLRSNSPNWFDYLNVIVVNQDRPYVYVSRTPLEFVDNLKFINDNFDSFLSTDTGCGIALVDAMQNAVLSSYQNSYVFVFADSQAKAATDPAQSLRMFDDVADKQIVITFFGTDPAMCGQGTFGTFETGLADFTGGDVFYTSQIDNVFYYISSFYSSGLVTSQVSASCTTAPLHFYFPIDVQTRAFTLSVTNGVSVTVSTPNGEDSGLYYSPIIDDDTVQIQQYITACPQRWDAQDVYCHRFYADEMTWIAAHYECYRSDATAHMVDILSDAKYQFVRTEGGGYNVWLSLTKNGTTQNDYYWSYPNVQDPIPLDPSLAHWAPNQNFADVNLRGVYMNTQDGLWYVENINTPHFFICQKHRYGQGFEPSTMESLIPPGYWHVSITGNQPTCTAQIRIQSAIQVFFGFTTDEHADTVTLEANANASANYVVAHASGLSPFPVQDLSTSEGRIDYVSVGMNGLSIFPLTVDPRADCTYDSVSTPFRCPNQAALLSNIQLKFQGIDQYGWPFTRYKESRCVQNLARCKNGGFAFNGECVCPEHFSGRSCEQIVCLNNGVATAAGTCTCPAFYTGQFCELPICDPAYPPLTPETRHTLVIAVETSMTMDYNNFEISLVLANAMNTIVNAHPGYYTNFMLYPFDSQNNKQNWFPPLTTTDYTQISATFNSWDLQTCIDPCPDETTECGRPIVQLLIDILSNPALEKPNSHIVVITRSAFSDYELFPELQSYIAIAKPKIEFVLAGITSPCSYPWDDNSNVVMQTVATMADGGIYAFSSPLDIGNKFLSIFVPTLYESQFIAEDVGLNAQCRNNEYVFQVDHSASQLVIEYFSSDPSSLYLIRPDGTNYSLPADAATTVLNTPSNYVGVLNVNTAIPPGSYILRGLSPDSTFCTALVRASSDIILTPAYSVVHDDFNGATQDDGYFQPIAGGPNVITVNAKGLDTGNLEYVQILDRYGRTTYTAHLRPRASDCTYQYYADHPFTCPNASLPFEVIVYGRDNRGQLFHRNFNTQCVTTALPPPPPAPTCDLKSQKIDFVFLIDSSSSIDDTTFRKLVNFVRYVAVRYTNQLPYAQFAVTTVSNVAGAGGSISFEDYNLDPGAFLSNLDTLTRDGGIGQDLTAAINYAKLNFLSAAHQFRSDKSIKHNMVYVTASPTPTDSDPGNQVDNLKRDGLIGFTVVAPFETQPSDLLLSLGGEQCGYYPRTDGDLIVGAVNFINGITCRTARVCGV